MASPISASDRGSKLLGLEVIRFVCALSVLFWHYQHFSYIGGEGVNFVKERQPFYSTFSGLYNYGYYGVVIFWCISGFIFFWKYRQPIADRVVGGRTFLMLRFSRLYPLHFVTLLSVAALQIVYFSRKGVYFVFQDNDVLHFLLQLFMASNWFSVSTLGDSFNGPIWSISIEIIVYCIFFAVLRFIGKSPLINVAIIIVSLGAKLFKVPTPIVECLTFFYLGGLSAIAFQYVRTQRWKRLANALVTAAALMVPAAVLVSGAYRQQHFPTAFLLIYLPILLYTCAYDLAIGQRIHKMIEAAGNMTYSSYLVHFPIQLTIAVVFAYLNRPIPYQRSSLFVFFFSTTLIASYCVYRGFEMPAQAYIRNQYKRMRRGWAVST